MRIFGAYAGAPSQRSWLAVRVDTKPQHRGRGCSFRSLRSRSAWQRQGRRGGEGEGQGGRHPPAVAAAVVRPSGGGCRRAAAHCGVAGGSPGRPSSAQRRHGGEEPQAEGPREARPQRPPQGCCGKAPARSRSGCNGGSSSGSTGGSSGSSCGTGSGSASGVGGGLRRRAAAGGSPSGGAAAGGGSVRMAGCPGGSGGPPHAAPIRAGGPGWLGKVGGGGSQLPVELRGVRQGRRQQLAAFRAPPNPLRRAGGVEADEARGHHRTRQDAAQPLWSRAAEMRAAEPAVLPGAGLLSGGRGGAGSHCRVCSLAPLCQGDACLHQGERPTAGRCSGCSAPLGSRPGCWCRCTGARARAACCGSPPVPVARLCAVRRGGVLHVVFCQGPSLQSGRLETGLLRWGGPSRELP